MKFKRTIYINNKIVSDDSPVFIIAEAGVNHGGDMNIAKKLIDVASDAGADAVKFQAFKTEHLILQNVKKAPYQQKTTAKDESQYNMLKKLEVTKEQNLELIEYCRQKDIIFLTTPFDEYSLDELDSVELPAYKVASTDTTNLPFLRKMAMKDKPIILSTGMSYLSEVRMALEEIYKYNQDVILLQCTANYPIKDDEANLNVINTYKDNFDILIGYSDHSVGIGASPYAVPMGAKVVEKHFTLSKDDDGPDHAASLTPEELKEYVKTIRKVEKYLGTSIKKPSLDELKTRASLQKSLVAARDLKKDNIFSENDLIAKRTGGTGISPIYFHDIIGKTITKDYNKDDIIDE
jgi:N,N'-diacetyllegionaminate synthase